MTRYVIYGAGAVGGGIGGLLQHHGHDTILIARGAHLEALQREGLRLRTRTDDLRIPVVAVGHPDEIVFRGDEVVILTMKTQDTVAALDELRDAAGSAVPVVCAQNGVANERFAARRFQHVYGMLVQLPSTYLEPGQVFVQGAPRNGVLYAGRYPSGVDEVVQVLCRDLADSTFVTDAVPNVMSWKYTKLLHNLVNAVEVVCGLESGQRVLGAARREAEAVYHAAGIAFVPIGEFAQHTAFAEPIDVPGARRAGTSTLQSLMRGLSTLETDYLNGEISMLGSIHGIPTPVNRALQDLSARIARSGAAPGSITEEEVFALAESR